MITERQFPYIRPAKGKKVRKTPVPSKDVDKTKRFLRSLSFPKKPISLPKLNLPE